MARRTKKAKTLTHLDAKGRARMVDVAEKPATRRSATAEATLHMKPATLKAMLDGTAPKGDVLAVARVAGIQAAKRTGDLIPLCHPLALSSVTVDFEPKKKGILRVLVTASCVGPTGVEMEALCAASVAALTVYDMLKAVNRGMSIDKVRLLAKSGGRSGDWKRKGT